MNHHWEEPSGRKGTFTGARKMPVFLRPVNNWRFLTMEDSDIFSTMMKTNPLDEIEIVYQVMLIFYDQFLCKLL